MTKSEYPKYYTQQVSYGDLMNRYWAYKLDRPYGNAEVVQNDLSIATLAQQNTKKATCASKREAIRRLKQKYGPRIVITP